MSTAPHRFAARVMHWQAEHGRQHLPWQGTQDPYRVWLSEIMLQQTQVVTVLGYYTRFVQRFPTVSDLAQAPLDDVLALWSGLGYYSRARNMHRCAQTVHDEHGGAFPPTAEQLAQLPGIGRSTAAAIAAFCFAQRVAILDGNVRRVLARHAGFEQDLSVARHMHSLWDVATERLPTRDLATQMPRYTQGMMDLGATLCSTRKPRCQECPVRGDCQAQLGGEPERLPVKSRKLKRSTESLWLLLAQNAQGAVWLAPRPIKGVWGGLYAPPIFKSHEALQAAIETAPAKHTRLLPMVKHVLTHKDLFLHPVHVARAKTPELAGAWVSLDQALALGLPAPVRVLLEQLTCA